MPPLAIRRGDVVEGNVYIVRGLKVAAETVWDDGKWKYVPRGDGTKKAECKDRTAMEDVTHVEEIMQFSNDEWGDGLFSNSNA